MEINDTVKEILKIKRSLEKEIRELIFDEDFFIDLDVLLEENELKTYIIKAGKKVKGEKVSKDDEDYFSIKVDDLVTIRQVKKKDCLKDKLYSHIKCECIQTIKNNIFKTKTKGRNFNNKNAINRAIINYMNDVTRGKLDLLNGLALDNYEKRPNEGKIIFVDKFSSAVCCEFKKFKTFSDENRRLIRKLLEITSEKFAMIISKGRICGFGNNSEALTILYSQRGWETIINEKIKISYGKGKYSIKPINNKVLYESELAKINVKNKEALINLVIKLNSMEHHGALFVFTAQAEKEAKRLGEKNRGITFARPIDFSNSENIEMVSNFSAIDGALLFDFNLKCHGIGYILDGLAYIEGAQDRGSRFNSAKCYLWNLKSRYFDFDDRSPAGLVFSEDGDINCLTTEINPKSVERDEGRIYKFNSKEGEKIVLNIDGK